ncbi:hypothetical protein [Actinomyces oris]|jgi:tetratricopeptide repeat protein|uniref:tetratricopeptide repeat protein n=1 Tax=Actinomyces oris TaxID=544580 RepID=UPI0028EDE23A|nr:hypothetical protein [Actinomyces oris]
MEVAMLSRKPQKAVHSTDPGQSAWWFLLTLGGTAFAAAISYSATHSTAWATAGGAIVPAAAAIPQLRNWVSARTRRRQIAESAGVATDITEQPLESLRVHSSDRNITEFVPRDIQHQLVEHLNNGTPVLIEGPSMSGKTRLAIETIRSHWPEAPVWFPRDDGDIEKLLSSNQEPTPETVIILDDLDRFLSNQTLTLGLLNQWTKNSCIIIATMMHSQYVKHSDRTNEKASGWDTVNRFKTITLTNSLSANELNVVKHTSYAEQISQIKSIGLGPLLGCAEAVRTAFTDELEKHSWCGALIKAAADWRRIGLGPASREQLTVFSETHKDDAWGPVNWDEAWNKATNPVNDAIALLHPTGDDQWEVLDIIADSADWPLSTQTLAASLKTPHLSGNQIFQITQTALSSDTPSPQIMDLAQEVYEKAVTADPTNAYLLVSYASFLHLVRDNIDEANKFYEKALHIDPKNRLLTTTYSKFSLETYFRDSKKVHFRAATGTTNTRRYLRNTPNIREATQQAREVSTKRGKSNDQHS